MFEVLYQTTPHHTRAALFSAEGRLLALHIDDAARPLRNGAVVLGRVRKIASGLNAAFVDIGDHHDGFLRLNTLPPELKNLTEGAVVACRITRAADLAKGAKLDARVAHQIPEDADIPSIVQHPPNALQRILHDAGDTPIRCWVNTPDDVADLEERIPEQSIFTLAEHLECDLHERLSDALERLQTGLYPLQTPYGTGQLIIENTTALTAIDVDAGDLSGNRKEAVKALNEAAALEVARLCRLQDLGGNVMVDFVTMSNPRHRMQVSDLLRQQFAQTDMAKVDVRPMSPHGLVEINRERTGAMLHELLAYPHIIAGEILLTLNHHKTTYLQAQEVFVEAHPHVTDILKQRLTRTQAQEQFGRPITYQERKEWPETKFTVST